MVQRNNMKKILIIHDYPHREGGGVEVQGFLDAQELVARGYSVTIASTRKTSETYNGDFVPSKNGVNFAVIKSKEELADIIDEFDVIHVRATFSLREGIMNALQILVEKQRKFLISIHTNINHLYFGALADKTEEERQKLLSEFALLISSPCATIIGVSKSLRESLNVLGVSKEFIVVHNAKDWKTFLPSKNTKKVPLADITYIGEISCMKGVHTLLSTIVLLKKEIPQIKVRLIGGGTSQIECLSLIRILGLEENIEHIGHIEHRLIPNYLVRTRILTLPSLTESWGNIVMESMGLGTITVSSRVEGLIELTQNGKYGFLCERGNSQDFTNIFSKIITKDISLPYSVNEIKKYVKKNFSLRKRVDMLEKLYIMD